MLVKEEYLDEREMFKSNLSLGKTPTILMQSMHKSRSALFKESNTIEDGRFEEIVKGTGIKMLQGQDPMDAQLEMSCDRLVNKMLYYLSQISIQKSFFSLIPRFKDLVEYSRFEGYMDNFFQKTKQMEETTVLYTAKESGSYLMTFDQSYLDKEFFDENPVRPPSD